MIGPDSNVHVLIDCGSSTGKVSWVKFPDSIRSISCCQWSMPLLITYANEDSESMPIYTRQSLLVPNEIHSHTQYALFFRCIIFLPACYCLAVDVITEHLAVMV